MYRPGRTRTCGQGKNESLIGGEHAEQLTQAQRSADERVQAVTEALAVAKEATETYRAQLTTAGTSTGKRPVPCKRTQS